MVSIELQKLDPWSFNKCVES